MRDSPTVLRVVSFVVRGLVLWALVALAFWVAVLVAPRFDLPSFEAAVLATGAVVVINTLLWPLVIRLVLPLTVITFGLGSLLLNAGVVALAIKLVDGSAPTAARSPGVSFRALAQPDAAGAGAQLR